MKTLYAAITAILFSTASLAQELPYDLNISTVPFEFLDEPISLSNGDLWDDPEYAIPFDLDFKMNDVSLTSLSVTENFLGGALGLSNDASAFYSIGLLEDLIEVGGLTGLKPESDISYQVTGDAPNRILKVQWSNAGFFDDNSDAVNRTTYQIWLYEGIYDIRICFGPNSVQQEFIDTTPLTTVAIIFDLDFDEYSSDGTWLLDGDPLMATAETVDFSDYDYKNLPQFSSYPTDGTCFHFATGLVSTEENVSEEFSIYPTVTKDNLNVINKTRGAASVDFLNLSGQVVKSEVMTGKMKSFDVSELSSGVYFCRIHSEENYKTYRFIKK